MKKPKYFKGSKKKTKKSIKEPVVEKSERRQIFSEARFPKNSRPIPEKAPKKTPKVLLDVHTWKTSLKKKRVWLEAWNVVGIVLLLLLGFSMVSQLQGIARENKERDVVQEKFAKWQKIAQTYPGYRDAYMQMGALSYSLGEKEKAGSYIEKAVSLDPNNKVVRRLEEEIQKMK